jgi:hypothetical protein
MSQVYLRCYKISGKLRVRIISPGYNQQANCQFPRAIRQEGRLFSVAPSRIHLSQAKGGAYFYRINQPIGICEETTTGDVVSTATMTLSRTARRARTGMTNTKAKTLPTTKKKTREEMEKPIQVYDHQDEPTCVVCLENEKEKIFVPCGHYCMCAECISQLGVPKKCPMCRQAVRTSILPSEMQRE